MYHEYDGQKKIDLERIATEEMSDLIDSSDESKMESEADPSQTKRKKKPAWKTENYIEIAMNDYLNSG
jgi:hypothetical protein